MSEQIVKNLDEKMQKTLAALKSEFGSIRGNRATPSILDNIRVDYYGTATALTHLGTVSTPEPRTITITPWDKGVIPEIEKAIQKSDLGLTPVDDGNLIRISLPPLSEERRRDLVKIIKKIAEESRVSMRNIRRESNDELKLALKDKKITEDDEKRLLKKVQDVTDDFIKKVDGLLTAKEKDIMEV